MSKQVRKYHSPQEKTAILREHLINGVPVSDLCDQNGVQPSMFYRWQKAAFEGMESVFESRRDSESAKLRKQVEELQAKLAKKDMVIAQITEDYVTLKKSLGEG
ncbi:MAG: transposase [Magnetococcus sp. XQGC-1]